MEGLSTCVSSCISARKTDSGTPVCSLALCLQKSVKKDSTQVQDLCRASFWVFLRVLEKLISDSSIQHQSPKMASNGHGRNGEATAWARPAQATKATRPPTKYRRALGANEGNGVQGPTLFELMREEKTRNFFLSQEHITAPLQMKASEALQMRAGVPGQNIGGAAPLGFESNRCELEG